MYQTCKVRFCIYCVFLLTAMSAALLFSGCQMAGKESPGKMKTITLPDLFVTQAVVQYGDVAAEMEGMFTFSPAGECSMKIQRPKSMHGLTVEIAQGQLHTQYGDLSMQVDSAVQPRGAVLSVPQQALDIVNGVTFKAPDAPGACMLTLQTEELGKLQVVLSGEKYLPQQILIDDLDFRVQFSPPG